MMSRHPQRHAFTIVELLIVIAVIGVLAALVFVAYSNYTTKATETSLRTDLHNDSNIVEAINSSDKGSFPILQSDANLKQSGKNVIRYRKQGNGYCIDATNGNQSFYFSTLKGQIVSGKCTNAGIAQTIAGSGVSGYDSGSGINASFYSLNALASDQSGNIYIVDGHRIRIMSPYGNVTELAGKTTGGVAVDGTGTAATFYNPLGIAVDSSGTAYVADWGNNKVRKVTSAGVVTTLAGSGTSGEQNGPGTTAQFNNMYGLALDKNGNAYVAEYTGTIRKIAPDGTVSTLAGDGSNGAVDLDGTGMAARFSSPSSLAVSNDGTYLYVGETNGSKVRKVTIPGGVVTTFAGSTQGYVDGVGTAARFLVIVGVAVDVDNNLYVAENPINGCRIRKVTPDGTVTTLAGTNANGYLDATGTNALFATCGGIAVDAAGTIYIGDIGNHRVRTVQ